MGIMLKLKTVSTLHLRFPEYGMNNTYNFRLGLPLASHHERVRKGYLFKRMAPRINNSVTPSISVPLVWHDQYLKMYIGFSNLNPLAPVVIISIIIIMDTSFMPPKSPIKGGKSTFIYGNDAKAKSGSKIPCVWND